MADTRLKPYPADGIAPLQKHHPMVNPSAPTSGIEDENNPGLGRADRYLTLNRVANDNLTDDPTDSGEAVRNKRSYKNLAGGR